MKQHSKSEAEAAPLTDDLTEIREDIRRLRVLAESVEETINRRSRMMRSPCATIAWGIIFHYVFLLLIAAIVFGVYWVIQLAIIYKAQVAEGESTAPSSGQVAPP